MLILKIWIFHNNLFFFLPRDVIMKSDSKGYYKRFCCVTKFDNVNTFKKMFRDYVFSIFWSLTMSTPFKFPAIGKIGIHELMWSTLKTLGPTQDRLCTHIMSACMFQGSNFGVCNFVLAAFRLQKYDVYIWGKTLIVIFI